jgi:hypothetical protein
MPMQVRLTLFGGSKFTSYSHSQGSRSIGAAVPTLGWRATVRRRSPSLLAIAVALSALVCAAPWLAAQAPLPTVTSVYPSGYPGENLPTVVIRGSGFQAGAQCNFGADITVNSCTFNSSAQVTADVSVSAAAAQNFHPITVTNPDGQSGTRANGFLVGPAPRPNQIATFSFRPSSSGTVTVPLPQLPKQHSTLIVGVSFWPADITGVFVNELGSGQGDVLRRGLATSLFHDGPGSPFYTNFYYGPNHGYQLSGLGPDTLTLTFSGGATNVLIAVAEVSGLACLDCGELDDSAYNEALTSADSWSSGPATTSAFDEYLFSWGATEAADSMCSNPGSGWTLESQTNDPSGAAVCLLDRFVEAPGLSYQASVKASPAENYGMEIVKFANQLGGRPAVTSVNPSFGAQGQSVPNIVVAGAFFDSSVVCSFGAGITVNSCTFNSSTQLVANITITSAAAVGPHYVTVTSTNNNAGWTLANAFSVTPGGPAPDFTISAAPAAQSVLSGGAAKFAVTLMATGGFSDAVNLRCTNLPPGVACAFDSSSITPKTSGSQVTLTVTTPPTLAQGNDKFTVSAASGSITHTQDLQVAIGGITGSISPTSATIAAGSSSNFQVAMNSTGGFTGQVTLVCSGAPSGMNCGFAPPQTTLAANGSVTSTLTVQVASKPAGSMIPHAPRNFPGPVSRNVQLTSIGIAMLVAALFMIALPKKIFRVLRVDGGWARGFAMAALVLFIALGLLSCGGVTTAPNTSGGGGTGVTSAGTGGTSGGTSGTGSGGGDTGGGTGGTGGGTGGSTSVTTQFIVQVQSGGATVNVGTVSITVP